MPAGWCDEKYGWGPIANETYALTTCFASTVLELPSPWLAMLVLVPGIASLHRKPFVKPSKSWTFGVKLSLSFIGMLCAIVLAALGQPSSHANTWAQVSLALAWFTCVFSLVSGHLRAEPQKWRVQMFWALELVIHALVFANHSMLGPSLWTHLVRGVSFACLGVLVPLSFVVPRDVPSYEAVEWMSPHPRLNSSGSGFTPLLSSASGLPRPTSSLSLPRNTPAMAPRLPNRASQLSETTMFGATTSSYREAIAIWEQALVERSIQQQDDEPSAEDDALSRVSSPPFEALRDEGDSVFLSSPV